MITSKEIYDSYPNKNSYEWLSRGRHIYKVLLDKEIVLNKEKVKKKK